MLVRYGLDVLAEGTVVELGPLHSKVDIVEPQFDGGDRGVEDVQLAGPLLVEFGVDPARQQSLPWLPARTIGRAFAAPPFGSAHDGSMP